MHPILKTALAASAATLVGAGSAQAVPFGVTLADGGNTLVTLSDLSNPGALGSVALTDGTTTPVRLSSITYRPRTDELIGFSSRNDTVYRVNAQTGFATAIVTAPANAVSNNNNTGADFNNVIDALRIVNPDNENLVFFPFGNPRNEPAGAPTVQRFTDLFYVAGDLNFGRDPRVVANAYTNAIPMPTATLQFVLDAANDSLATLGNNAGTLTTIGVLTLNGVRVDFGADAGFDILSLSEGDNTAFALLDVGGVEGLYTFGLTATNGQVPVTFLGAFGDQFGPVRSLAVFDVTAVPVPAALPLLASALGLMAWLGRRRQTAAA